MFKLVTKRNYTLNHGEDYPAIHLNNSGIYFNAKLIKAYSRGMKHVKVFHDEEGKMLGFKFTPPCPDSFTMSKTGKTENRGKGISGGGVAKMLIKAGARVKHGNRAFSLGNGQVDCYIEYEVKNND